MAERRPGQLSGPRVVVDTNVVAYFVLGTPAFAAESRLFWHRLKGEPLAPGLWESELANILWKAQQSGVLTAEAAQDGITRAAGLGIRSVELRGLWHGALARAGLSGISVYDTLFVELAVRERTRLVTWDRRLLEGFPDCTCRPSQWAG